jgi:hypothetical protein
MHIGVIGDGHIGGSLTLRLNSASIANSQGPETSLSSPQKPRPMTGSPGNVARSLGSPTNLRHGRRVSNGQPAGPDRWSR